MTLLPRWLHDWLGLQYAEKRLPFSIALPLVKSATAPVLNTLYQRQKHRETQEHDEQFLVLLLKNVRQLNRYKASMSRRLDYNHRLTALFYPLAVVLVGQFSKNGGVPDSQRRAEVLDCMIAICGELVNSYGLVIQHYQQSSPFRYARSLKKIDLATFRLLELLKFKQTMKALRYQALSARSWGMANSVVHILAANQRLTVLQKTLDQQYRRDQPLALGRAVDVYLALQMVERMQLSYWPVQWQTWLIRSIGVGDLKINLNQDGSNVKSTQTSLVYYADTEPTRFTATQSHDQRSPLVIEWDALQQVMTSDLAQVIRSRQSGGSVSLSKHLSLFGPDEQLAIAQLQYQCFRRYPSRNTYPSDQKKEIPDLRIFIGFNEILALLRHVESGGGWKGVGRRMSDLLARHSAVFSDDAVGTVESAWFLQHQDDNMICLSTLESRHTSHMNIGDLAAYMLEQRDWHQPRLGIIQRIVRPQAGQVNVEIQFMSEHAESVLIDMAEASLVNQPNDKHVGAEEPIRAIKGMRDGVLQLILPRGVHLRDQQKLALHSKKGLQRVQRGHVISASKACTVFALRACNDANNGKQGETAPVRMSDVIDQ